MCLTPGWTAACVGTGGSQRWEQGSRVRPAPEEVPLHPAAEGSGRGGAAGCCPPRGGSSRVWGWAVVFHWEFALRSGCCLPPSRCCLGCPGAQKGRSVPPKLYPLPLNLPFPNRPYMLAAVRRLPAPEEPPVPVKRTLSAPALQVASAPCIYSSPPSRSGPSLLGSTFPVSARRAPSSASQPAGTSRHSPGRRTDRRGGWAWGSGGCSHRRTLWMGSCWAGEGSEGFVSRGGAGCRIPVALSRVFKGKLKSTEPKAFYFPFPSRATALR